MTAILQSSCRNRLLKHFAPDDFSMLGDDLEIFEGTTGAILEQPGVASAFVYFPETGVASITSLMDPYRLETGMVGKEGFVGIPVLLSDGTINSSSSVQVPGRFLRVPASMFRSVVLSRPSVLDLMLRYVQAYIVQITATSIASLTCTVEQRLARWLLMISDRTDQNEMALTHEFVASMLGVRRAGITVATHVLEGEHAIRAVRGRIKIVDRVRLRVLATMAYGKAEAEYTRLIGEPLPSHSNLQDPDCVLHDSNGAVGFDDKLEAGADTFR